MKKSDKAEVWLRGPIPEIPDLLQPVAHALLQAGEELELFDGLFPTHLLWEKPSSVASVGFHLQHLTGVLDRLFTYARGGSLGESQLEYLKAETNPIAPDATYHKLLTRFNEQVSLALEQLKQTDETQLTEVRYVGRAMIPSTQLGLLFHAAEHTQRHVGQLLVTAKILTSTTH